MLHFFLLFVNAVPIIGSAPYTTANGDADILRISYDLKTKALGVGTSDDYLQQLQVRDATGVQTRMEIDGRHKIKSYDLNNGNLCVVHMTEGILWKTYLPNASIDDENLGARIDALLDAYNQISRRADVGGFASHAAAIIPEVAKFVSYIIPLEIMTILTKAQPTDEEKIAVLSEWLETEEAIRSTLLELYFSTPDNKGLEAVLSRRFIERQDEEMAKRLEKMHEKRNLEEQRKTERDFATQAYNALNNIGKAFNEKETQLFTNEDLLSLSERNPAYLGITIPILLGRTLTPACVTKIINLLKQKPPSFLNLKHLEYRNIAFLKNAFADDALTSLLTTQVTLSTMPTESVTLMLQSLLSNIFPRELADCFIQENALHQLDSQNLSSFFYTNEPLKNTGGMRLQELSDAIARFIKKNQSRLGVLSTALQKLTEDVQQRFDSASTDITDKADLQRRVFKKLQTFIGAYPNLLTLSDQTKADIERIAATIIH